MDAVMDKEGGVRELEKCLAIWFGFESEEERIVVGGQDRDGDVEYRETRVVLNEEPIVINDEDQEDHAGRSRHKVNQAQRKPKGQGPGRKPKQTRKKMRKTSQKERQAFSGPFG